ncbi:hypothetical protein IV102_09240 [bacterium]|nr:hypothetical protein [bacterium]
MEAASRRLTNGRTLVGRWRLQHSSGTGCRCHVVEGPGLEIRRFGANLDLFLDSRHRPDCELRLHPSGLSYLALLDNDQGEAFVSFRRDRWEQGGLVRVEYAGHEAEPTFYA